MKDNKALFDTLFASEGSDKGGCYEPLGYTITRVTTISRDYNITCSLRCLRNDFTSGAYDLSLERSGMERCTNTAHSVRYIVEIMA